ncbi:MAG: tetratricopeptide repeat protein, partial [Proteobacteria bacterium]
AGAYEHYLIAELSLRMFKHNPSELRYLKVASEMSQQAIEIAPNKEYGYLVAAQVLDLMGYRDEAVEMLAERPSFAQGWRTSFVRGVLAASQEGDNQSFKDFEKSLKTDADSTELVSIYVANGLEANLSGQPLVDALQTWRKKVDTSAIQTSLARALDEVGKSDEAYSILYSLNKREPSDETKYSEAVLLYSKLKRSKDAEKLFKEIVASSKVDELKNSSKAHLAKIALVRGDNKLASNLFLDSIENSKEQMKWITFTHKAYTESKRLEAFSVFLDDLSMEIPGSSYLYALKGEVLSESLSQHEKAVESFAAAITLDPKRSEFYNGMGLAYYRMRQNEKALSTFNIALSIDPKDATARYNEACVLALMGRGDEAVGSLKQAISLDGRLQTVALKDKDFEGIRTNAQFQTLVQESKLTKTP